MKQKVLLNTYLWDKRITPQVFFAKMPYMFRHFDFVQSNNPKFAIVDPNTKIKVPKNCTKIFYTGEDKRPDLKNYDWALSFDYDELLRNPKHFRFPNYVRLGAGADLVKPKSYDPEKILRTKTKFCAFIYWNQVPFRDKFCAALSSYKNVDAPGRAMNNMPTIEKVVNIKNLKKEFGKVFYRSYDLKLEFLKPYKFVFGFENTSSIGYTTEKIYHAMLVNSLPLYWGNKMVYKDFNTSSFINYSDYKSVADVINIVKEIDQNDNLYMDYLSQPWYPNNKVTPYANTKRIVNKFKQIFGGK